MQCFEKMNCPPQKRDICSVYRAFRDNRENKENLKCWIVNDENKLGQNKVSEKCLACDYYISMNSGALIVSDINVVPAYIICDGTINNDRNIALNKAWQTLKNNNKNKVVLDLSDVNNIYSSGLGTIISIHKDVVSMGGLLVVICAEGYVKNLLNFTRLSRILKIVGDRNEAVEAFDAFDKQSAKKTSPDILTNSNEKQLPRTGPKPACYEYWNNNNPNGSVFCDTCMKKIKKSNRPCWVSEGVIEGVTFKYVDEKCEKCRYFAEFGRDSIENL